MYRGTLWEFLGVNIGTVIVALGLVLFLIPNKIAAGGVSGLATIIYYVFHFPVGVTMLVLNIPLFLGGIKELGMSFGLKTLWGTLILSLFVDYFTPRWGPVTSDPFLAAIYGGILMGAGLGIVFRSQATTGGSDLAAQLLRIYLKSSSGQALLLIDGVVIVLAGFVFDIELALYAFVALIVTSKVIDIVQEGIGYVKAALIISSRSEEISQEIFNKLDRGATALEGKGLYTGSKRQVLLTVVGRAEVSSLKSLVSRIDPEAFVIITHVHEALGEGFKDIVENKI